MQIKEVDVEKTEIFSIGRQYSHNVLVIHFVNLPNIKNKYIYYKIDDIEEEIPLVSDLFIVSRPLTMHSGKVKAQIIVRDEANETIDLTKNFTMIIKASNYSGIGEDENYPDDLNIKNYFVKIDEKVNSFEELANLVQTKLDNGEFIGAQGPKGDPGDVTEEYRNLAMQIAQNASDAQTSATNAQKALDDTKEFANQTKSEMNQIKNDTELLKNEANTSAVNAKASENKAKEYADKLQISTDDISQLKEDLVNQKKVINELNDKKITKFYASNQGEINITDSDNGNIQDMMIYGKSSQDGTPSPENPVDINTVVNPTVKVSNKDETKSKIVTVPYTLNAIPVSSGGNITINGQQYIADYVDVEKGKLHRKVKRLNLKDVDSSNISHGFHLNGNGYLSISILNGKTNGTVISNQYKSSSWTMENGYVYIPNDKTIIFVDDRFTDKPTAIGLIKDTYVIYELQAQVEEDLTSEQVEALKMLSTYYPVTKITVGSEQLDGYTVFNYPISMANGWNYVKQQLNDNRDYIYDMDLQSAEAYVNSEYAVTLTELEV